MTTVFVSLRSLWPAIFTLDRMKFCVAAVLALNSPLGWAAGPYEGSWFTCVFEMSGRRNPWHVQEIRREDGKLQVFSEWGTKYTFLGTARKVGNELVVRGCSFYVDSPMEGCDPADPPIAQKLKLPLRTTAPSNLDSALRRGESILLRDPKHFERLASWCEELIDAQEARKARR